MVFGVVLGLLLRLKLTLRLRLQLRFRLRLRLRLILKLRLKLRLRVVSRDRLTWQKLTMLLFHKPVLVFFGQADFWFLFFGTQYSVCYVGRALTRRPAGRPSGRATQLI